MFAISSSSFLVFGAIWSDGMHVLEFALIEADCLKLFRLGVDLFKSIPASAVIFMNKSAAMLR